MFRIHNGDVRRRGGGGVFKSCSKSQERSTCSGQEKINNMEVIIFAILSHTLHLVLTMHVLFSRDAQKIVINISLPQSFAVLWNS